jgi:hypothetical protein
VRALNRDVGRVFASRKAKMRGASTYEPRTPAPSELGRGLEKKQGC